MEEANFTIKSCIFDKVNFNLVDIPDHKLNLELEPTGVFSKKDKSYRLTFVFRAKNSNGGEVVSIQCQAVFEFKAPLTLQDIPEHFFANSIAIVFPYMRSFISMTTLQAGLIPPIQLPIMNLTSFAPALKERSIEIE